MAAANVSSILDQSKVDSKAESSAGHDHSSVKGEILSKSLPEMMIGDEKKLTSRRSVSSKGKSVKSERLMKAFQADLDVMDKEDQIEILQREHEHAIKMQKAKMELKRLRIKKQLEQKLSELDESDEDDNLTETSRSSNILLPRESREESVQRFFNSQPVDDVEVKDADPVVPEVGQAKPVTQDTLTSSWMEKVAESLTHVANMIMQQNATSQQVAAASQLPKIDVPVFDGDPLRYPLWRNAFSSFVDSKPLDAATKLNLLNNHVTGEPKTVVEHYLLLGTDEAYLKARESLANRYGNTSIVSSAFMKKLNSWPRISDRNPGGLRSFADFLQQVSVAKMTVDSLGILDYPQENVKLVMKLPFYLERKWRDEVDKWQRCGYGTYPTFAIFTEFVRSAAEKANIPELEHSRPDESKQKSVPSKSKNFQGRSFSTSAETNKRIEYSSCPCCKQDHHLDDCPSFQKKSYHAKKAFFFQKYLCMGCGESSSHLVKECTKKRKCKKCGEAHLTCLHREKAEQSSGSSKCTSVCSLPDQDGKDHCMIVPVWVRHADNPSREYLEYAILDDQSNVGFVSKDLCDRMEVQGQETDLMLTTMHQSTHVRCQKISGLEVLDFHKKQIIQLPPCFTREEVPAKRSQIPKADVLRRWSHLAPIADQLMPYNPAIKVSLLIGNNCPRAIRPREVIAGGEDDPYGMRTSLGWGVVGRVCQTPSQPEDSAVCNRIQVKQEYPHFVHSTKVKEVFSPETVLKILEQDFQMTSPKGAPLSVQEARFMSILEDGIRQRSDGHYEMPLPLKSDEASFPDNKILALKRWRQLSARFRKNPKFLADYKTFMEDVVTNYAERVPADCLDVQDGRVNYVPHTGVYHPRKPDQIRVVFDCSAKYQGVSLNDHLLQGPDLMNGLLGVLCRFRKEAVAFMADVKGMFLQFYVKEEDRNLLRFLWYKDGDETNEVVEYRMKVHLFGAASSPGCSNFGLMRAADDGEEEYGSDAADFIRNDFYVDDGLSSRPTPEEAIKVLKNSQAICAKAGLKLHKFVSNSREVLRGFPVEERAKSLQDVDLDIDKLVLERALGVSWNVENDTFSFRVQVKKNPFSRRGVLSTISSIYDPSGFLGPVILKGKRILQSMCKQNLDWDAPMPDELRPEWEKWLHDLQHLNDLQFMRCYKPSGFGDIKQVELHHFSDASQDGYGQCSYLRLINQEDKAHCSFVIGKARVTPLRQVTIPRLELTAATLSAKSSAFLKSELRYESVVEFFWTDSQVVLGYVKNEARRFHVFVANRVQLIRDLTEPDSWFYIDTSNNPADEASRGITAQHLVQGSSWLTGPKFLWENGIFKPKQETTSANPTVEEDDPEVRRATVMATGAERKTPPENFEVDRFQRFSSWQKAHKAVARCLQLKKRLQRREVKPCAPVQDSTVKPSLLPLTVSMLKDAEKAILKSVQQDCFPEEMRELQELSNTTQFADRQAARLRNVSLKKTSALYRLDPYLDDDGIIRVGGRIDRANISSEIKHPIILPRRSHISKLLILHHHQRTHHMGRGITHNELRQAGYWVIGGSSAVSQCISSCVTCRRRRGPMVQQKMAELPDDRVEPSAPFTYCGVDYFGPFLVKERRSQVKRYGVIFTCMASRSVHLETASSLTSSSFINALRRFMNRRGAVRQLRSDQGTMFVGARSELREALAEMDQSEVQEYLLQNGCDWIPFKMNVPHASHMGGVWERQIQTVRRVLEPLMKSAGSQLDDEAFRTFMTEAEAIINSRPLTTSGLSDHEPPEPLTPLHLLTMKPKVVLPPPGQFQREDMYARKWWRRVQYLTNQFWLRWRREYLQQLQNRQKWVSPSRQLAVGDVVIAKENDDARGRWPLARVIEVYPSKDGLIRKVKVLMADGLLDNEGKRQRPPSELERPVHKLVLLLPAEQ
ncbi:uncharacterized protein [Diadema antillarum]|uniref:uncharacterized protein n=1 Tax=Diadema antillarum TaxID=105358 RepID=UPI003A885AB3